MFRAAVVAAAMLLVTPSPTYSDFPRTREEIRTELRDAFLAASRGDTASTPSLSAARSKKSAGLAVLFSLLVPGMGELYAEGFSSGKYFLIGDAVLWLTYAVIDIQGTAMRDDARAFAVSRASVQAGGKNDQFFVDVGNFQSIDEYNDKKLRDREPSRLYDPAAGYAWRWSTEQERLDFRGQRVASENMFNNRKFVGAALLLNRIASAINAARAAAAFNNALDRIDVGATILGNPGMAHGVALSLTARF